MHKILSALLVAAFVALASLIPGGPIETRDFSHISPVLLGIFNFILTSIGLSSVVFAYFVALKDKWAIVGGLLAGISYFVVYVLDLFRLFPVSPSPMPLSLEVIELISVMLAISIMYFATRLLLQRDTPKSGSGSKRRWRGFLPWSIAGVLAALAIVAYATVSAMG
ncbi:MAG: hypothetical protein HWE26_13440 [Alteromonadaceae bacterium]|nr:hypothetical protein [Alteromonadaceae bacterium]